MNIDNLKCFIQVVKCNSFAKAAELEHLTQSAVSRKIESLERELEATLFLRDRRNLTLTPAGKEFYIQALSLIEQYTSAIRLVKNLSQGYIKEFRIGIGFYEHFLLKDTLEIFVKNNPQARILLYQFPYIDLLEQFTRNNLDIILTSDQFLSDNIFTSHTAHLLCDKPWLVGMSKNNPLFYTSPLYAHHLKNQTLISMHTGEINQIKSIYHAQLSQFFKDIVSVNSFDTKMSLVAANYGICFIPPFITTDSYPQVKLKALADNYIPRKFFILKNKEKTNLGNSFVEICLKSTEHFRTE